MSTQISDYYATLQLGSLNWIEQLWAAWYTAIPNPIIATGLLSFLLHEIVYFGRCVPWVIIDATPFFHKWKLQPNKVPTVQQQLHCAKMVIFYHFIVELPVIWLFHPVAEAFGMATYHVPLPVAQVMVPQIAFFFVFEDFYHFCAHRMLHWGPLYQHIHKLHHTHSAPFGLATEYAHPLEVLILAIGSIGGPLLYCMVTHNLHIFTVYVWIALRLLQAIDAHSGYDFPWSLHNFIPFWAGAEHHDFHHMSFTNNFATSFRWWDRICGTDTKFREYLARVGDAREANLSAAAQSTLEFSLMARIEAEGLIAESELSAKTKMG